MVGSLTLCLLAASATVERSASRSNVTISSSVNRLFLMGHSRVPSHLPRNQWSEIHRQSITNISARPNMKFNTLAGRVGFKMKSIFQLMQAEERVEPAEMLPQGMTLRLTA